MKKIFLFLFIFSFIFSIKFSQASEEEDYYDLKTNKIEVLPTKPALNQEVLVRVEIRNVGTLPIRTGEAFSSIVFDFSNFELDKTTYPVVDSNNRLEVGKSVYYIISGKFTALGEQSLYFKVNNNQSLKEKDEKNNFLERKTEVLSWDGFDLGVDEFEVIPKEPLAGEHLTFKFTYKNTGNVSLNSNRTLRDRDDVGATPIIKSDLAFAFSDFVVTDVFLIGDYPSLEKPFAVGKKISYLVKGYFKTAGEKDFSFTLNANQVIKEKDFINNTFSEKIFVYNSESERDAFEIGEHKLEFFSNSNLRLSWSSSEETLGEVFYKVIGEANYKSVKTKLGKDHQVVLKNLIPAENYNIKIVATKDTINKEIALIQKMPQEKKVLVESEDLKVNEQAIVVNWETNYLANAFFYYKNEDKDSFLVSRRNDLRFEHGFEIKNLNPGIYNYYLASCIATSTAAYTDCFTSQIKNFTIKSASENVQDEKVQEEEKEIISKPETGKQIEKFLTVKEGALLKNLRGKIILQVENKGEAWYVHPLKNSLYYLGRPTEAFEVMRSEGIGISNADLNKIPVGLNFLSGQDSDGDGLPDLLEEAIGTDPNNKDTDDDGYDDKTEIENGFDPKRGGGARLPIDFNFAGKQKGKIFLQVENKGEAWYVHPTDGKRYFLGRPTDAFNLMRNLGLGISEQNFQLLNK